MARCSGGSGDTIRICAAALSGGCSAVKGSLCVGSAGIDGADDAGSCAASGRSGVAGAKRVGSGIAGVVFGST
jgi:hypothetical protein